MNGRISAGRVSRWAVFLGLMYMMGAVQAVPAEEEAQREPALRKIDSGQDAAARKEIRHYRSLLPEQLRFRGNFAWARADIEGLDKEEFFAHSRIQNLDSFSSNTAERLSGISPRPERESAQFQTLFVDAEGNIDGPNAMPRWFDTEYKIMEDMAARLPDTSVKGEILLYTDLEPCRSCWGVMKQFMAVYTNVNIEVLHRWP